MTYTAPAVSDLKTRFPAFTATPDATVEVVLREALTYVSDDWVTQDDYTQGAILYCAHLLTLDGHGTGSEAKFASAGLLGFKSITSGKLTVQRDSAVDASGGSSGTLMQTQYGRRFRELQARNISGARVV